MPAHPREMDANPSSYVVWMLALALVLHGVTLVGRPDPPPRRPGFEALAAFLVGLSVLLLVMGPVHFAPASYADVIATWRRILPLVAALGAASGFLTALSRTSGAVGPALAVGGPAAMYAAFAWAAYAAIDHLASPDDPMRDELVRYATPVLSLLTAFPAIAFGASVAGGVAARAVGARAR